MDSFFGIGILELVFILIFALIFLGPERLPGTIRQSLQYYNQFRQIVAELSRNLSGEAELLRTFSQEIHQEGEKLMKLGREPEQQPQPKPASSPLAEDPKSSLTPATRSEPALIEERAKVPVNS
jgi:Tat protein translocase TatB subunit